MQRWSNSTFGRIIPVIGLVLSAFLQFVPAPANAAAFTQAYVRLDRMKANTAGPGLVCAKASTAGAGTEGRITVTFPTGYTLSSTLADWVTGTTNIPSGSTAYPTISANATNVTGQTVTWTSGDLANNTTLYCFTFGTNVTNPVTTTAGAASSQQANVESQTSGGAAIDHTDIALATITDDQIVVSAIVPPTFIFTLSGNTDNFGANLDPSLIRSSAGRTVTVTTNAKGGWIAWARDSQQGLFSASANYTIPTAGTVNGTPNTLSAGTEGYVLDVDLTTDATGGCTLAIDAEYNGTTTSMGGTFSAQYQPIAACTGTPPATANGDVITLIERVAIAGATPAGSDYTDIITVVGAGNF
jgi:hypothetical protein